MNDVILDASALIAVVNREPGAERVMAVANGAVISALIAAEVATWLALRNMPEPEVRATLDSFNLRIEPFDRDGAIAAGLAAPRTKSRGLSLADRATLTLAVERKLPVLTADRAWRDTGLDVEVQFFR